MKKGLTLVELLLTMSLVLTLFVKVLTDFRTQTDKQKQIQTMQGLYLKLLQVRNSALVGKFAGLGFNGDSCPIDSTLGKMLSWSLKIEKNTVHKTQMILRCTYENLPDVWITSSHSFVITSFVNPDSGSDEPYGIEVVYKAYGKGVDFYCANSSWVYSSCSSSITYFTINIAGTDSPTIQIQRTGGLSYQT